MVVVEVVVNAEVLCVVDAMVHLDSELVTALRLNRNRNQGVAVRRRRNELQEIDSSGVHAPKRNDIAGEQVGVVRPVRDIRRIAERSSAGGALIESVGAG